MQFGKQIGTDSSIKLSELNRAEDWILQSSSIDALDSLKKTK